MTSSPNFSQGLLPAIIQDDQTGRVLMLGYMNAEAFEQSLRDKRICFFSRSKNRLWVKGESSGNFLELLSWRTDCDADALLFRVKPVGPTCHTGSSSCFGERETPFHFLEQLHELIQTRKKQPVVGSYTNQLLASGIDRMAQKVGEEGVETVIAAKNDDLNKLHEEAADLLYHLLVLLAGKETSLQEVVSVLQKRQWRR
ncbi:MAG: bifunctional phosphoribosyl-AMP cyclohydrolase/phosphoribosyl-ATP diphosphatase [Sphingobacteriaceae bacterium]|nr:bifunctional phosphoribosyl-AMP cyclohydrolase/phosphoribosyl-ATP diphosphatase [Sphingobacteriaceae bacterium]